MHEIYIKYPLHALRLSKALWGWISLVQNHKCCVPLGLYKLVMPEREVAVCSADEGQQARNSCPELRFFYLLASHGILLHVICYINTFHMCFHGRIAWKHFMPTDQLYLLNIECECEFGQIGMLFIYNSEEFAVVEKYGNATRVWTTSYTRHNYTNEIDCFSKNPFTATSNSK